LRAGRHQRPRGAQRRSALDVRTGIHLGDVVEEADGDLMGDGVNVAARLESICEPGGVCLSEDAWRQVRDKLPETFLDLGERQLKNIPRPMRAYALEGTGSACPAAPPAPPAGLAPARRGSRPVGALLAAVGELVDSIARLVGAHADRPATAGRAAIGTTDNVEHVAARALPDRGPAVPPALDVERLSPRARDRRLRRAIILAAALALVAVRECRAPQTYAPPPPSAQQRPPG